MSSVVNFAKRHKKKLIFTLVLFGGGYCSVKYATYKLKEFLLMSTNSTQILNKQMLSMKKNEHYRSIKETSDQGVLSLIRTMQNKINEDLSCDNLLEQLKQKPANKLAIWETLKIKCIAKCLTSVYAISLLTLLIKIELNVIGAYMFLSNSTNYATSEESNNEWSAEFLSQQDGLSSNVQQKFLDNIERFVNTGLGQLMFMVESHCEEVFRTVSLKESFDVDAISSKIELIKKRIEDELFDSSSQDGDAIQENFFTKHVFTGLVPNEKSCTSLIWNDNKKIKSDEEVLLCLNLETYDILGSSDFQLCLKSLTDLYTNEYIDTLTSQLVQQLVSSKDRTDPESNSLISVSMPFARLIPILNHSCAIFELNSTKNRVLNEPNLNVFSANIYEAFSIEKKPCMLFDEFDKDSMLNQVY